MKKKVIISLMIISLIIVGTWFYNSQKTIECWWGCLYPSLSFIAFEDEDEKEEEKIKVSSIDTTYIYVKPEEEPVKVKIAFIEWLKKMF